MKLGGCVGRIERIKGEKWGRADIIKYLVHIFEILKE